MYGPIILISLNRVAILGKELDRLPNLSKTEEDLKYQTIDVPDGLNGMYICKYILKDPVDFKFEEDEEYAIIEKKTLEWAGVYF